MYSVKNIRSVLPEGIELMEHMDKAAYYLRIWYMAGESIHVIYSDDIAYGDVSYNVIRRTADELFNYLYDHGNGD